MISQVKLIRQKLLLTQVEFAKLLGLSKQMINNYEAGRNKPSMVMIKKLMELCQEKGIEIKAEDFFA